MPPHVVWQPGGPCDLASYPDAQSKASEILVQLQPLAAREAGGGTRASSKALAFGERLAAAALLLGLLPLLTCAAMIVGMLSRRSPLVAHERVGQGGRTFWMLKLRTMWGCAAAVEGAPGFFAERLETKLVTETKRPDDPRITSRFAAFCRKYSIDELPQLWHVVEGRMSLVGPRPMTAQELSDHYREAAKEVLLHKPGLTGLWQIRGRSRLNYRQRRRFDLFLVRRWSPRLYLKILIATIPRILTARDAW